MPPGRLGVRKAKEILGHATELALAARKYRDIDSTAHDVDIELGDGRRLTGTVSGVYGDRVVFVTYSKLGGKHLLEAWIRLLALTAGVPGRQWSAVCIGRAKRGAAAAERHLVPDRRRSRGGGAARFGGPLRRGTPGTVAIAGEDLICLGEARLHERRRRTGGWISLAYRQVPGRGPGQAYARVWGKRAPLRTLLTRRDPARSWPASEPGWAHSRRGYGCRCCGPRGRAA